MRVLVEAITKEPENGRFKMAVRVGDEPVREFLGETYDPTSFVFEYDLFMRLSDLADKRYCHCAIYQAELMGIVKAFYYDGTPLTLPIELGTTTFAIPRPTATQILLARLRRPVAIAWFWWRSRHVRRENCLRSTKNFSNMT